MTYREMASLYDQLMKHAPYDKWHAFTNEMFKQSGDEFHTIADLGCGTGEITMKLAKDGYHLFGIDDSPDMLTYADQKTREQNHNIQWLQQDIREFQGLTNLDAAISYCDVINYITSREELVLVFNQVAKSLRPGGLFIFDIHSLYHVQNNLKSNTFADVSDDFSYIWFCSAGEFIGEMHHELTFFVRNMGKYLRFDEYHHQRTYSIDVYSDLLFEAGFEKPKLYSDFSTEMEKYNEKAERIFFVTNKRA